MRPPLLLLGGVLLAAGCALRAPVPGPRRPTTAVELLDGLSARRAALTSLRARARVRAGPTGVWMREALLVRRPDAVRVDVFSPFGLALALGVHGSLLWAYPPGEATCYQGPASPANVTRILGAPLAVADLVDILLGGPPARAPTAPPDLSVTPEGEYRLAVPFGPGVQTIWFAGDTHAVLRVEERREGAVVLLVAFGDHRDGFPRTLDLGAPAVGAAARLTYAEVETNPSLDATLFAPPLAPRVLPLEAAALPEAS